MMIAGLAKRLWMKEYGEGRKSEERKEIDFRGLDGIFRFFSGGVDFEGLSVFGDDG